MMRSSRNPDKRPEEYRLEFLNYLIDVLSDPDKLDTAFVGRMTIEKKENGKERNIGLKEAGDIFTANGEIDHKAAQANHISFQHPGRASSEALRTGYGLRMKMTPKELLILDAAIFEAAANYMPKYQAVALNNAMAIENDQERTIALNVTSASVHATAIISNIDYNGPMIENQQNGAKLSKGFLEYLQSKKQDLKNGLELGEFNDLCEAFVSMLPVEWQCYFNIYTADQGTKKDEDKLKVMLSLVKEMKDQRADINRGEITCKDAMEKFILPKMAELQIESNLKQQGLFHKKVSKVSAAIDRFVVHYQRTMSAKDQTVSASATSSPGQKAGK